MNSEYAFYWLRLVSRLPVKPVVKPGHPNWIFSSFLFFWWILREQKVQVSLSNPMGLKAACDAGSRARSRSRSMACVMEAVLVWVALSLGLPWYKFSKVLSHMLRRTKITGFRGWGPDRFKFRVQCPDGNCMEGPICPGRGDLKFHVLHISVRNPRWINLKLQYSMPSDPLPCQWASSCRRSIVHLVWGAPQLSPARTHTHTDRLRWRENLARAKNNDDKTFCI
jgi:hypothetical protein